MVNKYLSFNFVVGIICSILTGCARPDYQPPPGEAANYNKPDGLYRHRFHKLGVNLTAGWEAAPLIGKEAVLRLDFSLLNGQPAMFDPAMRLKVLLWMPSMGHGSGTPIIEKLSESSYRARRVVFIMGGEWEVRVIFEREGFKVDEIIQKISL